MGKTIAEVFEFYREAYTNEELQLMIESSLRLGYMLNGLDLELFKNKCISGEYKNRVQVIDGRRFDIKFFRLSPDVFLDWFQEYIFQRGEAFVTANGNTKQSENETSDKHIEILKVFADKATEREHKSEPLPENKYQKQAKELQKWIQDEFIQLWRSQNKPIMGNYEMVGYNEKPYLYEEYLQLRYEEIHKEYSDCYKENFLNSNQQTEFVYDQIQNLINGNNTP